MLTENDKRLREVKRTQALLKDKGQNITLSNGEKDFQADISTSLRNTMRIKMLNVEVIENDDMLINRINDFFNECITSSQMPNIEKVAVALGIAPKDLRAMKNGEKYFSPYTQRIVQDLYTTIASVQAEMAMKGKINPVVYIFTAKNYFDMVDTQQLQVSAPNKLEVSETKEVIESKYEELPD